jgi:hypothetical protein
MHDTNKQILLAAGPAGEVMTGGVVGRGFQPMSVQDERNMEQESGPIR